MIKFLSMSNEQTHPLHATDKNIIDSLITKEKPEDIDFVNLARLINRYTNFPGEFEIKDDIEKILKFWKITKNELFSKTKKIWSKNFRPSSTNKDLEITKSEENPFCNWSIIFFTSRGIATLKILTTKRAIAPYKNSFL